MTHPIDALVHNAVFGDGSAKVEARKENSACVLAAALREGFRGPTDFPQ